MDRTDLQIIIISLFTILLMIMFPPWALLTHDKNVFAYVLTEYAFVFTKPDFYHVVNLERLLFQIAIVAITCTLIIVIRHYNKREFNDAPKDPNLL